MLANFDRLAPSWTPHAGQREFLENPARFKVLACGRRWGKTDACAAQIVASLFEPSPTRHILVAPTQDQANLLFERVLELYETLAGVVKPKVRRTPYPRATFGDHRLTTRSGHIARALRGNEATHIVVDEAAFVPESLVTDVIMPMLATTDGYLTLISTPNGRNHFWRFFQLGLAEQHGFWSRTGPSSESPLVSQRFLDIQRSIVSDRVFRIEYEAEFVDSERQFFRTEAIEQCVVDLLPDVDGPIVIGVDWARKHDATAVAVVRGTKARAVLLEARLVYEPAWELLAERVALTIERYPDALVLTDQTGVGDPMLEMLRRRLPDSPVSGLMFDNKVKTEMAFDLQAMFEHGRISTLPNQELQRELQYYEMTQNDLGHYKFGAPLGLHDDLVTALMLAVHRLRPAAGHHLRTGTSRAELLSHL